MQKWIAALGALVVLGQVAVGQVQAAPSQDQQVILASGTRQPSGGATVPDRPDSLTAGPLGDVKVELHSAWWVGNVRHSKFKVANVGAGVAYNVTLYSQYFVEENDGDDGSSVIEEQAIGNMPAGAIMFKTIVCAPDPGWHCDRSRLNGWTNGSDTNLSNNMAWDNF